MNKASILMNVSEKKAKKFSKQKKWPNKVEFFFSILNKYLSS